MTIISSQQELQAKLQRAEADIAIGNIHTLKDVYHRVAAFRKNKNVCVK